MTVSELTVADVKNYLRVDTNSDNSLIAVILSAAKRFCAQYTGLELTGLDDYEDMPLAVLAVAAVALFILFYPLASGTEGQIVLFNRNTFSQCLFSFYDVLVPQAGCR